MPLEHPATVSTPHWVLGGPRMNRPQHSNEQKDGPEHHFAARIGRLELTSQVY